MAAGQFFSGLRQKKKCDNTVLQILILICGIFHLNLRTAVKWTLCLNLRVLKLHFRVANLPPLGHFKFQGELWRVLGSGPRAPHHRHQHQPLYSWHGKSEQLSQSSPIGLCCMEAGKNTREMHANGSLISISTTQYLFCDITGGGCDDLYDSTACSYTCNQCRPCHNSAVNNSGDGCKIGIRNAMRSLGFWLMLLSWHTDLNGDFFFLQHA